jgi:hypothetical protein
VTGSDILMEKSRNISAYPYKEHLMWTADRWSDPKLQGGSPLQKLLEGTVSPTGRIIHESMERRDTVPQFFCDVMSDA